MPNRTNIALCLILAATVVGCQTAPVRYDLAAEGQWQAKALVRDKREGKSAVVNLDINAIQMKSLRVDVTAALGHPVASLVLNQNKMTYVLIESKQYYSGAPGSAALKSILAVPIDPRLFYNLLFDLPIEDKNWSCTKDAKGYLAECREMAGELMVRWSERQGRRKVIFIEHPQGQVQINVSSFKPKVEERSGLFALSPPKSFRQIR